MPEYLYTWLERVGELKTQKSCLMLSSFIKSLYTYLSWLWGDWSIQLKCQHLIERVTLYVQPSRSMNGWLAVLPSTDIMGDNYTWEIYHLPSLPSRLPAAAAATMAAAVKATVALSPSNRQEYQVRRVPSSSPRQCSSIDGNFHSRLTHAHSHNIALSLSRHQHAPGY